MSGLLLLLVTHPSAPARSGWWNSASVAEHSAPSTTAAANLHVAHGAGQDLAFAAVSFRSALHSSATLRLRVVAGSELGTPRLIACPTTNDNWSGGGNQPTSHAPTYVCTGRAVAAQVTTTDGLSYVTFPLHAEQQLDPRTTSLAILPAPGSAPAFAVDLTEATLAIIADPLPSPRAPAHTAATLELPPDPAAPPGFDGASTARLGPSQPPRLAQSPELAPPAAPVLGAAAPIESRTVDSQARKIAILMLLGFAAALACASRQRQQPLRLIGGRSDHSPAANLYEAPTRGIGRFARPRTTPPRELV